MFDFLRNKMDSYIDTEYLEDYDCVVNEMSETIVIDEVQPKPQNKKKKESCERKKQKKSEFSSEDKRKLCLSIKNHSCIWNLEDKFHKNSHATASSWKQVARGLRKPVEDCKIIWKSLKDSLRYHKGRIPKVGKSGSSAADVDGEIDDECTIIDWEFGNDMAFLKSASSENRRRTFSTTTTTDYEDVEDTSNNSTSNYSYMSKKPPATKLSNMVSTAERLTDTISELATARKNKSYHQKYEVSLNFLDTMLQKLPESTVSQLVLNFHIQVMDEIKKLEN